MNTTEHSPSSPEAVPVEAGGKWIAWDERAEKIVAYGATAEEATASAASAGVLEPFLEKAPSADAGFIGSL